MKHSGFDHEKLDVYRLELEFVGWTARLLREIRGGDAPLLGEVANQLDRASLSALLNTEEGNGKRRRQTRAKFFDDARGSASECAACLDALVAKGAITQDRISEGKDKLIRLTSMLTKLIGIFDDHDLVKEGVSAYELVAPNGNDIEDEGENEDD